MMKTRGGRFVVGMLVGAGCVLALKGLWDLVTG